MSDLKGPFNPRDESPSPGTRQLTGGCPVFFENELHIFGVDPPNENTPIRSGVSKTAIQVFSVIIF